MSKLTKETNTEGFYLREDGSVSPYNKSGYLWTDMHNLNMEAKIAAGGMWVKVAKGNWERKDGFVCEQCDTGVSHAHPSLNSTPEESDYMQQEALCSWKGGRK